MPRIFSQNPFFATILILLVKFSILKAKIKQTHILWEIVIFTSTTPSELDYSQPVAKKVTTYSYKIQNIYQHLSQDNGEIKTPYLKIKYAQDVLSIPEYE